MKVRVQRSSERVNEWGSLLIGKKEGKKGEERGRRRKDKVSLSSPEGVVRALVEHNHTHCGA